MEGEDWFLHPLLLVFQLPGAPAVMRAGSMSACTHSPAASQAALAFFWNSPWMGHVGAKLTAAASGLARILGGAPLPP